MDRRLIALAVVALTACGGPAATTTPAPSTAPSTVASSPAPSTAAPTRATSSPIATATTLPSTVAATTTAAPLTERVTVASGLANPWGVAFLPDGAALLTQRGSADVLRIDATGAAPRSVGQLTGLVPNFESGALGLATSPTFATDRRVYAYYTTATDNRVVSFAFDGDALSDPREVLVGIGKNMRHDGGRIAFGPDGKLYVATGDATQRSAAQDTGSLLGKILRLNPDGSVPADNPFPNSPVWSYGHRNVQGLAWDATGRMVASEFGENTFDEVNVIEKGKNYGWPTVEGPGGADKGFVDPVVTWSPTSTCSPSGISFDAKGAHLYVGCLAGQHLARIAWNDGKPATPERAVTDLGRVRGAALDPSGRLWAWTDNSGGDVVVMLPS